MLSVAVPVLTLASLATPLATSVGQVIAAQFLAGLALGTFIPLTISYIARNLHGPLLLIGVAAYAFNLELSLNIAASLEGFYLEHLTWGWIFWQNLFLAAPMFACVWFGMAREPVNAAAVKAFDGWGLGLFSLALALLYAALDQGNRLDWLGSGLIVGLLAAGRF